MPILHHIKVNGCVRENEKHIETSFSIHSYSDASEVSYGGAVYLAVQLLQRPKWHIKLHLANTVAEVNTIDHMNVNYWTDSMNVSWYVRNHSRKFKQFVPNKINEIQRLSAPGKWNHVKTRENPADLISPGMSIEGLALSDLWWYGLENLKNGNEISVKTDIADPQEHRKRKSFNFS